MVTTAKICHSPDCVSARRGSGVSTNTSPQNAAWALRASGRVGPGWPNKSQRLREKMRYPGSHSVSRRGTGGRSADGTCEDCSIWTRPWGCADYSPELLLEMSDLAAL